MSLEEKFREGLYDSERKPRLAFARNYFLEFALNKNIDFEELEKFYVDWRDYDEYLVLQRQSDNLRLLGEVDKETIAVKCAKRGNDVYRWRVWKRLKFLNDLKDRTLFDPHGNMKSSNVLFVSLTYDINRSTVREAWETVGEAFNKWIRNIRKKFGHISYLRCWEATGKGYAHIHVLIIFHDYNFHVERIKGKYRVLEKKEFEKSYHSFVDVQAVRKLKEGIAYITKYLFKAHSKSHAQDLTLALCWLFRKQSFAVSGDFREAIYGVTKIRQFVQIDLSLKKVDSRTAWVFIGIYSAELLGIDPSIWSCTLNLDDFYIYWRGDSQFDILVRKEEMNVEEMQLSRLELFS